MGNLPTFEIRTATTGKSGNSGEINTDLVPVFQDSGKKAIPPKGAYSAVIERLRKSEAFTARLGAAQFVRFGGKGAAENVLFLGAGSAAELTEEKLRRAGGNAWPKLVIEKSKTVAVHLDALLEGKELKAENTVRYARALAEGLILGAHEFVKNKAAGESSSAPKKIIFIARDKNLQAALGVELAQVHAAAEAIYITRDWSNEPSNIGTPEYYAAEARKLAREYGLKCKILNEAEAAREKMGLFLGVGQGAEREGRIVVLEYTPKKIAGKKPKTIAFVGKGVTFDSGGISIKPSMRMEEMKHDMTGAATMMGAIALAAKWKVPNRIVAILAFTENMPSGNAIQPGNVLKARNGKTVEIINTDAEGRLILADVLDYAHKFNPDAILDAATLTGAVSIALGKYCCAVLGNDETLIDAVRRAGDRNGERIWQLPLFDEYFDDMKSDYADMKNSCNDGYGGTIRGAMFLKQFIKKGVNWAHLDIAATAYNVGHLSYFPKKGATGAYVRTLAQFAADF